MDLKKNADNKLPEENKWFTENNIFQFTVKKRYKV